MTAPGGLPCRDRSAVWGSDGPGAKTGVAPPTNDRRWSFAGSTCQQPSELGLPLVRPPLLGGPPLLLPRGLARQGANSVKTSHSAALRQRPQRGGGPTVPHTRAICDDSRYRLLRNYGAPSSLSVSYSTTSTVSAEYRLSLRFCAAASAFCLVE